MARKGLLKYTEVRVAAEVIPLERGEAG
ncbi:MAG: hypothetical protein QOF99_1205, partial [Pseudonocardiales bacterium]|nr:hypothetical protein [Pseudonocardiales bacterium]